MHNHVNLGNFSIGSGMSAGCTADYGWSYNALQYHSLAYANYQLSLLKF